MELHRENIRYFYHRGTESAELHREDIRYFYHRVTESTELHRGFLRVSLCNLCLCGFFHRDYSFGNIANSSVTSETNCSVMFSQLKFINNPLGFPASFK